MFEVFDVGGLRTHKQAELVMYAYGGTSGGHTGVCVDIGECSSYVIPVLLVAFRSCTV